MTFGRGLCALLLGALLCSVSLGAQEYLTSYDWIDGGYVPLASSTVYTPGDDIEFSDPITLPDGRTFTFYGVSYTSVRIGACGYLVIGDDAGQAVADNYPSYIPPHRYVAPRWDPLAPTVGGEIRYGMDGDWFVVEWFDVPEGTNGYLIRMQARMNTVTSAIEFHYGDSGNNPDDSVFTNAEAVAIADGDAVTRGEVVDNAQGIEYVDNTGTMHGFPVGMRAIFEWPAYIRVADANGPFAHDAPAAGSARDFGAVTVGTGPSAPLEITVSNVGSAELMVFDISLTGPDSHEFSLVLPPLGPLAPGASLTFEIEFAASQPGHMQAFVEIAHNDGEESNPFRFEVIALGAITLLEVRLNHLEGPLVPYNSPAEGHLDFGSVKTSDMPASLHVYVLNVGTGPMTIGTPESDNPAFDVILSPEFPAVLEAGEHAMFIIAFETAQTIPVEAMISFPHNGSNTTSPFAFTVAGRAVLVSIIGGGGGGCAAGLGGLLPLLGLLLLAGAARRRRRAC